MTEAATSASPKSDSDLRCHVLKRLWTAQMSLSEADELLLRSGQPRLCPVSDTEVQHWSRAERWPIRLAVAWIAFRDLRAALMQSWAFKEFDHLFASESWPLEPNQIIRWPEAIDLLWASLQAERGVAAYDGVASLEPVPAWKWISSLRWMIAESGIGKSAEAVGEPPANAPVDPPHSSWGVEVEYPEVWVVRDDVLRNWPVISESHNVGPVALILPTSSDHAIVALKQAQSAGGKKGSAKRKVKAENWHKVALPKLRNLRSRYPNISNAQLGLRLLDEWRDQCDQPPKHALTKQIGLWIGYGQLAPRNED